MYKSYPNHKPTIYPKMLVTRTNILTVLLEYINLFNYNCNGNKKQLCDWACQSWAYLHKLHMFRNWYVSRYCL